MVSYAEAVEAARKCWDQIDYVEEEPDAFIFSKKDDFSFGGNGPVVVLKDSGRCINMVNYLDEGHDATTLREGYLKEFG